MSAFHSCSTASAKCVDTHGLYQDLDASLVFVVPAAMLVVDPQNGFQIGQQVFFVQPFTYYRADYRGATEATTNQYLEADLAQIIGYQFNTDIVMVYRGAILG